MTLPPPPEKEKKTKISKTNNLRHHTTFVDHNFSWPLTSTTKSG